VYLLLGASSRRPLTSVELYRTCRQLLGHASIQTTERYLGTEQDLSVVVNDGLGLEMD
jgi:integrase